MACPSIIRIVKLTCIQVLAPVLITYRVSTGEAWSRNVMTQSSIGPSVVTSGGGSRTALDSSGENIVLKVRDGNVAPNPGHIYSKNSEQEF